MKIACGTDIIEIDRIKKAMANNERFKTNIYPIFLVSSSNKSKSDLYNLSCLTRYFSNSLKALSQAIFCDILPASFNISLLSNNKYLSNKLLQSSIVIGIFLLALDSAKSKNEETINSNSLISSFNK